MLIHWCCLFACFNKLLIHIFSWNILLQICNSRFEPQLIVYNAGTDILDGDPLGRLKVFSPELYLQKPYETSNIMLQDAEIMFTLSFTY